MVDKIENVLMQRDGMSRWEAEELVSQAAQDFKDRLERGEMPFDICEEWFGLEPDYVEQLMYL
jgi:hypothetical protein